MLVPKQKHGQSAPLEEEAYMDGNTAFIRRKQLAFIRRKQLAFFCQERSFDLLGKIIGSPPSLPPARVLMRLNHKLHLHACCMPFLFTFNL